VLKTACLVAVFPFTVGVTGSHPDSKRKNRNTTNYFPPSTHTMQISVTRRAHFNAAHRLHNPSWTDEKNREVFGLCNNPHYHGHNYELEVRVTGDIDPETGMVVDLVWLSHLIREQIEDRFDHKNLNVEVPEFQDLNPTAENIAVVIWQILRGHLPERFGLHVRLYETPRNFVEVG
jgi:6-pyruvoyltetrahydropterin/6-carboxytetrahydropterin synthase